MPPRPPPRPPRDILGVGGALGGCDFQLSWDSIILDGLIGMSRSFGSSLSWGGANASDRTPAVVVI